MARRKNTKRIDPRYFLNETTYRDLEEEEIPPTTSHDEQGNYTGPQLDEKEVLQLVQNLYKAMRSARGNVQGYSRNGTVKDWASQEAKERATRPQPELELKAWFQDRVGAPMYHASRAMAPVYDAVKQGWRGSANWVDIVTHYAGDMAEKFLKVKTPEEKVAFLNQLDEITKEYFENTERFGKGSIR